jgi:light-regulated signal transduction histidine kinase (bacteriophytochrome)
MQTYIPLCPGDPVDLTNCDREPIHIPGSIQPHGVLLAATDPEFIVVQASVNTREILGIDHEAVLGVALSDLLEEPGVSGLSRLNSAPSLHYLDVLPIRIGERAFDGIPHRSGGLIILELEPASREGDELDRLRDLYNLVYDGLNRLEKASRLYDLFLALAAIVREISGFDRVMVYRFDERDGSGEVIAEERHADMEPYLGLHYPASDVPSQVRRLYVQNRLRLICDAAYRPAPIVPAHNPLSGGPLDLGNAVLRSVSPIHCEYLKNMGVRGSMSVSIVKDERLWGLVACHHREPRFVPYRTRVLCGFLGDFVSWMLHARLETEEERARLRASKVQKQLVETLSAQSDFMEGLVADGSSVIELVGARGFAVSHNGRVATSGVTPSSEQLAALLGWLEQSMVGDVFVTDRLPAVYPPAAAFQDKASGLLATSVSNARRAFLLWFRPEVVREVNWGGDPRKPVEVEAERLTPRKSFALWKEMVRGRSVPWTACEIDAATELRSATGKVILRKVAERLNIELRQAVESRDEFLSMASHELKTPTTTLRLHLAAFRRMAERGQVVPEHLLARIAKAERQVDRFELLINQLLDVSRIAAGRLDLDRTNVDLAELTREVVERFGDQGAALRIDAAGDLLGHWDRFRLDQVLTNLLTNALKYGLGKPVDIVLRGEGGRVRCAVHDRGIGISEDAQA